MARKISKGKVSEQIEREEQEKKEKRKAMDQLELRRLARQARMMKEAKLKDAFVEKNTKVKEIIIKENQNFQDNLNLMKSKRRCVMDTKQAQNIANLFAQGDDLDAAIAKEKNYIDDLESQIRKDTQNIQAVKKKSGNAVFISEYTQKQENERAGRTLESWKSRLAAEQYQLALTIKENKDMRDKLQRLLKEKGQFNKLFEELMGKLTKGKRVMADIVDQSKQEFQKRAEVSRKIDALRSRDKADLEKRMTEMGDLEKRMYEDKTLAEFRHRMHVVRTKLVNGLRTSVKDTLEQERFTRRLERAHEFWEQLREVTGLTTADEMSKSIIAEDSRLFSLFNYNNEIRDQLEVLTQKTADLVRTVDDEEAVAEERTEQELKSRNNMEKKLEVLEQANSDLGDLYDANARLFGRLLDKIKFLFDLMKCNSTVLQDLLGNNKEVTEHNFRLYLALVETAVINNLDKLSSFFPAQSSTFKTTTGVKKAPSVRTISRAKSTMTTTVRVDKKMITTACWECEGTVRAKLY